MSAFQILAFAAVLTAICSVFSIKVLKLNGSLGMAISGAAVSALAFVAGNLSPAVEHFAQSMWKSLNFQEAVFHGMLCFLLFAGAMHVNLAKMKRWGWHIGLLATVGVVVSTFAIAGLLWLLSQAVGYQIPWAWLLVFGALISPTDPIAVLSLLKKLGASKDLEVKIAAESLFNDGTGVVIFSVLLAMASASEPMGASQIAGLFGREAIGGLVAGLLAGWFVHKLLSSIDEPGTETAITLACALGLYAGAEAIHVSAPLAVAACGIVVGNGKSKSMSQQTQAKLLPFWEMVDEMLNMALFALVGVALMATEWSVAALLAGCAAIVASLAGRWLSVGAGLGALHVLGQKTAKGSVAAMTWGGLRGGLSLAMALSLPESPWKSTLITSTWFVVMFSLVVQATSMSMLLNKVGLISKKEEDKSVEP